MSKMTSELIEKLYEYGKKVYNKELSLSDATAEVLQSYKDSIAESSTEFYIGLVKDLVIGKGSTWNQNSDLLVYYVEHISVEMGTAIGTKAYQGAMKFAKAKSRQPLIDSLNKLKEQYGLDGQEDSNDEEVGETDLETKKTIDQIKKYIEAKGFSYDNNLIENFYLSLKSKPFVILAGTSGTGKTKLVKLFAEAIDARYKLVSVRPDWSDSSDLFGHTNLKGEFVPGAIIDYIKEASSDLQRPYFLCLDEMNLARVEYYLSDFLSLIETRKRCNSEVITECIELDKAATDYKGLYLPENLYFIGTVNMDETTFPFSKKVLDRANTIEFSFVDLMLDYDDEGDETTIPQNNEFLKTEYLVLKKDITEGQQQLVTKVCDELQTINKILQEANAHVGYRVRDEIVFYMLNNDAAKLIKYEDAFDNEIMQKILPRIQGSSAGVRDLLCKLFKKFAGDYSSFSDDKIWEQMQAFIANKNCKYKNSAIKICYMMRRYEEDGFTSYWL